jgi:hypothetical protein
MITLKFIPTDSDNDTDDVPFFEKNNPLGPRINLALMNVYDGQHSPYFVHINLSGTGYIAICSQELPEETIKKAYEDWLSFIDEGGDENDITILK